MLTKALLTAAKAKITDPKHWTKETFFRDAQGNDTGYLSDRTTCMCGAGALAAALADANTELHRPTILETKEFGDAWHALNELAGRYTGGDLYFVQAINDQQGHDATLRFFDYAIEVTDP